MSRRRSAGGRRKVFTRRDVIVAVAPAAVRPGPRRAGLGRRLSSGPTGRSSRSSAWPAPPSGPTPAPRSSPSSPPSPPTSPRASPRPARPSSPPGRSTPPSTGKEAELGRPLTHGQARAVHGICGSGRQVELVVGVAGSGKTTALACVRDAYQAAGYRVVGTSTSGQAARTLGREAGIDESRTLASLLWRLDHGRLTLDARTVVILDEAGMTADPDLLRVLVAAEAARAKVVLVGDDRQLGPVGPGGALGGLVERPGGRARAGRERPPGRPGRAAGPQPAPSRRRRPGGRLVRRPRPHRHRPHPGRGARRHGRRLARRHPRRPRRRPVRLAAGQRRRAQPAGPGRLGRRRPPHRPRGRSARRAPLRRRRPDRHPRPRRRRPDRHQRTGRRRTH